MAALDPESPASRYDRMWGEIQDDRAQRGLLDQPDERKEREFVDPVTGTSAVPA